MKEIWKTIPGYENYQVSNLGRVKSLKFNRGKKEKIMKEKKSTNGYLNIGLRKDNKSKLFMIHRLVYLVFNDLPIKFIGHTEKDCILHKDDNPKNNKLDNLFIGTQKDNVYDCINKNRRNYVKGENVYRSVMKKDDILFIRNNLLGKINYQSIAKIYNVSASCIEHIIHRRSWKHI